MSNEYFALDANVAALAQAFGEDMGDVKRRILKDATTFPTRAEMVAALPSLASSPDGRIVFANGEGYMRDRNASDIPDMPGWKRWEPIPGVINASDIVRYGEQSPNPAKQAQARQNLGLGSSSIYNEEYFEKADSTGLETGTFRLKHWLDKADWQAAANGDLNAQDANRVTSAFQSFHEAALSWWSGGGNRSVKLEYPSGQFVVNDELFSEDSAQKIWDLDWRHQHNKIVFSFDNTTIVARFDTHSASRSSGIYSQYSIEHKVPKVLFRWMQSQYRTHSPIFTGNLFVRGSADASKDPVAFWFYKMNSSKSLGSISVTSLYNTPFVIDSVFNSHFRDLTAGGSTGYQPTEFGGSFGLAPNAALFSVEGVNITSDADFFKTEDVGKRFCISGAGNSTSSVRNNFWGEIASVSGPRQAVLSSPVAANVSGRRGSFHTVTVSTSAGSPNIVLSAPLSGDLVGRMITIPSQGGSAHGQILTAFVVSHSGDTLTLSRDATHTDTEAPIVFSSQFFIGRTQLAEVDGGSRSDDLTFSRLWAENEGWSQGSVGVVIAGTHIDFDTGTKNHGASNTRSNNFAGNFTQLIVGNSENNRFRGVSTHGMHSPVFGKHMFVGDVMHFDMEGESNSYPSCDGGAEIYIHTRNPVTSRPWRVFWSMGLDTPSFPQSNQEMIRHKGILPDGAVVSNGSVRPARNGVEESWLPSRFGPLIVDGKISGDAVQSSPMDKTEGRLLRADYGYSPANIFSTLGFNGAGQASGGIIETGKGSGGTYVKFANGLMMCFTRITGIDVDNAYGSIYRSNRFSWTFPRPFIVGSIWGAVVQGYLLSNSGLGVAVPYGDVTATCRDMRAMSVVPVTNRQVKLFAIGQWSDWNGGQWSA